MNTPFQQFVQKIPAQCRIGQQGEETVFDRIIHVAQWEEFQFLQLRGIFFPYGFPVVLYDNAAHEVNRESAEFSFQSLDGATHGLLLAGIFVQFADSLEVVSGQCGNPFGRGGLGDGAWADVVGIEDGVGLDDVPCVVVQDGGEGLVLDEPFFGELQVDAHA